MTRAIEDVLGNDGTLGTAVLARLGGGNAVHLAWLVLDDDVAALLQGARLDRGGC